MKNMDDLDKAIKKQTELNELLNKLNELNIPSVERLIVLERLKELLGVS